MIFFRKLSANGDESSSNRVKCVCGGGGEVGPHRLSFVSIQLGSCLAARENAHDVEYVQLNIPLQSITAH